MDIVFQSLTEALTKFSLSIESFNGRLENLAAKIQTLKESVDITNVKLEELAVKIGNYGRRGPYKKKGTQVVIGQSNGQGKNDDKKNVEWGCGKGKGKSISMGSASRSVASQSTVPPLILTLPKYSGSITGKRDKNYQSFLTPPRSPVLGEIESLFPELFQPQMDEGRANPIGPSTPPVPQQKLSEFMAPVNPQPMDSRKPVSSATSSAATALPVIPQYSFVRIPRCNIPLCCHNIEDVNCPFRAYLNSM